MQALLDRAHHAWLSSMARKNGDSLEYTLSKVAFGIATNMTKVAFDYRNPPKKELEDETTEPKKVRPDKTDIHKKRDDSAERKAD
jgi:hypothetical protein